MTARRTLAVAATSGAALLLTGLGATPASAHGSLTSPVSRTSACGAEGQYAATAACQAAVQASGPQAVSQWDNLRVPNVAGRDREVIPDGRLCSGGIDTYRGLDLARPDWPATRVSAGSAFTFTYRGTIPHKGTFKLYVTRDGYQPSQPLRWDDLEAQPFQSFTDPELRNGSYQMAGAMPAAKSGRHVIYAIWQNTDTPDTYYSCSDVDFGGEPATDQNRPVPGARDAVAAQPETDVRTVPIADRSSKLLLPITGGAAALLLAVLALIVVRRRRA
jgi:predicted carbohydrate-binding protein with CBM5 and CBM33 domain